MVQGWGMFLSIKLRVVASTPCSLVHFLLWFVAGAAHGIAQPLLQSLL